jgi:hypothetical protein
VGGKDCAGYGRVRNTKGRNTMKNKVVFFEIPASNFKQAKDFYEQVFD